MQHSSTVAHPHTTSTVLMVRPVDFAFNEQTASDNEFQHMPDRRPEEVNRAAMDEFERSVQLLRDAGVDVIVLEGSDEKSLEEEAMEMGLGSRLASKKRPDAVFPNNWFSTHPDGTMVIYPMCTPNRRDETLRHREVQRMFHDKGLEVKNVVQLGRIDEDEKFLEGTGSMVIDHINGIVYAARSVRTHDEQLENFMKVSGYKQCIAFDTRSASGLPFYHTNVMMSVGKEFAVVCTESIVEEHQDMVIDALKCGGQREVIHITLEQAEKYFCGNILQLKSASGENVIAMSESCLKGFTESQLESLRRHGKIAPLPVANTIEFVGGGSARCMIAEVFLPRREEL